MEQSSQAYPAEAQAVKRSATDRVTFGILQALEQQRLVPGQRLIETEIAAQYSVGRNAVREAMQRLATRGVVDLSRHRSATIRMLSTAEALEVLEVAAPMTALVARIAARNFDAVKHGSALQTAIDEIEERATDRDPALFSRARRRFYRTLLMIGGNRELQRIFPAIQMHIIYSQYRSPKLIDIRLADYRAICDAVIAGNSKQAEIAATDHVARVCEIVIELSRNSPTS